MTLPAYGPVFFLSPLRQAAGRALAQRGGCTRYLLKWSSHPQGGDIRRRRAVVSTVGSAMA
ncbi:hypothetical protein ETAE_1243 [Edwardsiella piscicida]|uniref:Uncharacterized protein n=1 Tax=Edwardsiella piscicida TaxID=1263550 RepID=A0AAU8PFQ6_EDWPI|nr:hypothetical protein ETAE_1243 [Edwardsiella tarda EIB202]